MTFRGFLRLCCALLLAASAFFTSTDAQQTTYAITLSTSGPNSGAVSVRWSSGNQGGNSICNAPIGGATCQIPNIPAGASVLITANQPGVAGVITDPAFCNLKTTCTFSITADTTAHVGFGDVAGVTFQTFTMQLAGAGEGSGGADNNSCQNFDPLQYSACATHYATGSQVNLTTFRIPNSAFVGFSGGTTQEAQAGCTTANPTCSFALNSDASVTATFARLNSIAVTPASAQTTIGGNVNFQATGTFANNGNVTRTLNNGDLGYWKFKAPLSTARFGHTLSAMNGRLYAAGGVRNTLDSEFCPPGFTAHGYCVNANNSVNTTPVASVEAYDPTTNTWSAAPQMSLGARASHAAAVAGSTPKLYVLGGSTSGNATVSTVEAFDGATWSQVASLSGPRRLLGAAALNGIVYVVGGRDDNGNTLSTVEAFNTNNPGNGWTARASMPTARHSLGVVAVNGLIYAIGGGAANGNNLNTVEVYNPGNNTWSSKASMQSGRTIFGTAAVGNQIYVVGGNSNGFLGSLLAYDTVSDQWFNKAFLPQLVQNGVFQSSSRADLGAASINGIVYAVGGNVVPPPNQQPPNTLATSMVQAYNDALNWTSSNSGIARISQFGQATGVSTGGPVTITARTGSLTCAASNSCGSLTVAGLSIQVFVNPNGSNTVAGSNNAFACVSFRDPSPNPGPWTATVDFGDGTSLVTIPSGSIGTPQQLCGAPPGGPGSPNGAFQLSHNYANAGNYIAHITVNGQGGITGSNNLPVHVEPPSECVNVTFNITGNNYPFTGVDVQVFNLANNPPTPEDGGTLPIGTTTLTVEPGSFRVVFAPPAGYVAQPASVDLNLHCNDSVTVNVTVGPADTTAPVTTASGSPAPNGAGWNTGNVAVTLSATDNAGGSGVAGITYSVSGAQSQAATVVNGSSAAVTITADGSSTVTFFATDNAGNAEAPKTFTVRIDRTAPTIAFTRAPAPNANGWNNTPVTVAFQCADGLSGLAAGSPPAPTIVGDGAGQSVTGTCADLAGNSASATVSNINVDTSAPVATVSPSSATLWPPNGKMVPVVVSGTMADAGSGVNAASFTVVDEYGAVQPSGPVSVAPNGSYSFTVMLEARRAGTDQDGRTYQVVVTATNSAGLSTSASTVVTVPHDQGK